MLPSVDLRRDHDAAVIGAHADDPRPRPHVQALGAQDVAQRPPDLGLVAAEQALAPLQNRLVAE